MARTMTSVPCWSIWTLLDGRSGERFGFDQGAGRLIELKECFQGMVRPLPMPVLILPSVQVKISDGQCRS
jgi:hypothetical protein